MLQLKTYTYVVENLVIMTIGTCSQVILNSRVLVLSNNIYIMMRANTHWDSSQLGLVQ